ncbi:MAG: hypothetical protein ACREGC_00735 [Minisyncoccia bacterium]
MDLKLFKQERRRGQMVVVAEFNEKGKQITEWMVVGCETEDEWKELFGSGHGNGILKRHSSMDKDKISFHMLINEDSKEPRRFFGIKVPSLEREGERSVRHPLEDVVAEA